MIINFIVYILAGSPAPDSPAPLDAPAAASQDSQAQLDAPAAVSPGSGAGIPALASQAPETSPAEAPALQAPPMSGAGLPAPALQAPPEPPHRLVSGLLEERLGAVGLDGLERFSLANASS